MPTRLAPFVVACLLTLGCDKPAPPDQPATSAQSPPTAEPPAQTSGEAPDSWSRLASDALSEGQSVQLDKAKAAQKELGTSLAKALTASVAADGFAASIEFCRGAAPEVAEQVAASHALQIGRTSHKLRNPKNTAPEWAADAVAKPEPGMKVFTGPSGELGVLSPIELAPLCANCHGDPDKLAEGVMTAVSEKYPDDQATGFAPGDLRGWFWVEVPAS